MIEDPYADDVQNICQNFCECYILRTWLIASRWMVMCQDDCPGIELQCLFDNLSGMNCCMVDCTGKNLFESEDSMLRIQKQTGKDFMLSCTELTAYNRFGTFYRENCSASRTFPPRSFIENGFWRKCTPSSSTPWWAMTLAV